MKTIQITETEQPGVERIPCQLGKVSQRPCSFFCAFVLHDCPVMLLDQGGSPVMKKISEIDLLPLIEGR